MAVILFTRSVLHTAEKNFDTNWDPLLVRNFDGIPGLAVHCFKKRKETVMAFIVGLGIALVSLVYRSVMKKIN